MSKGEHVHNAHAQADSWSRLHMSVEQPAVPSRTIDKVACPLIASTS